MGRIDADKSAIVRRIFAGVRPLLDETAGDGGVDAIQKGDAANGEDPEEVLAGGRGIGFRRPSAVSRCD
jgi:hypothetical protein